jgi:hypothetical protein
MNTFKVGQIWEYNDPPVRFIVLYINEKGWVYGVPLRIEKNQYGAPALIGTFNHVERTGLTCAGLMGLPQTAKLVQDVVDAPRD